MYLPLWAHLLKLYMVLFWGRLRGEQDAVPALVVGWLERGRNYDWLVLSVCPPLGVGLFMAVVVDLDLREVWGPRE